VEHGITRLTPRWVDESRVTAIVAAVGVQLRREREDRSWTIIQVGDACGMSKSTLCRFELWQRAPSLRQLVRIGLALGMRSSDVLRAAEDHALMVRGRDGRS
jgi:transcriptional regulator with XRE-family HTH domain